MVESLFIGFLVFVISYFCTRTLNHWRNKNVAGPKPLPLFGNLIESAFRRKHVGMVYKEIYDAFPNEKVIGMYRMTAPTLIIRDLDTVKNILIKDFEVFPDRGIGFSKVKLGDNLFHCDSDTWRVLRKRLSPVFTSGKTKIMLQAMIENGDRFIEYLDKNIMKNREQEMWKHLEKYTMSTIIATACGVNIDAYNNKVTAMEKAGFYSFRATHKAELDMVLPRILKKMNISLYNSYMYRFCHEIVKASTQQKKGNISRNDAIDAMIDMKQKGKLPAIKRYELEKDLVMDFTDDVMAGQVFIMFIAGFGNNALTISYALFHLAKHQHIQTKLLQEIEEVLNKHDGKLSYEAVKEMLYLEQIFHETLRLNPLTNSVQRASAQRYRIPGTDVIVEEDTTMIISPYAIHRDARNYPNPDEFDPERFTPENSAKRHPCAYIPFGAGPRSCIGRQLARLQFAVALIKIVSRFRIQPSDKTLKIEDYDPMYTLIATKGGIHVKLIPRTRSIE